MDSQLKEPLWTKNFVLITVVNFILFVSFQMLLPTLPIYAESLGGDELVVGLIIGIFTASAVLIRPYAGLLMDRKGRRGVLTIGLIIFVISVLLYKYTYSVALLLGLRIIHGIGWGAATTASGTVAADVIPPKRRGEGLGFYGMSASFSMAFAPALGLLIVKKIGFSWLFILSTILAIIALGLTQLIKYPPILKEEETIKPAIFERSSFPTSSVLFFLTFIYGGIITFIALYAKSVGIENVAMFFTIYAVVLLITRPIAGRILDSRGADLPVITGIMLAIAGVVVLGLAQSMNYFIVSSILLGIGFGASQPSLQALTIMLAPPERRGAANATFFSAFDLGIGAGAILLGLLSGWVGYGMMYLISSLAGVIAIFLYWVLLGGNKKHGEKGRNIGGN